MLFFLLLLLFHLICFKNDFFSCFDDPSTVPYRCDNVERQRRPFLLFASQVLCSEEQLNCTEEQIRENIQVPLEVERLP